jgi:hypothetical protein
MKRKLYDVLVPESVREKIYASNVRHFKEREAKRLRSIEDSIPRAELSSVYIANLRVLTDRNALLHALPKCGVAAQVGVGTGDSTYRLLSIAKPQRLHVLDPWAGWDHDHSLDIVENQFRAEIESEQVIIGHGFSVPELAEFENDYFDWVYIDADRSYEYMAGALETCKMKVKEDGIIAGGNYAIGSWIDGVRYGVIEAVNLFCKKHQWEMIYLTHESHRHLSYAIRRMVP